jgi:hypothetical protein
VWHSIKGAYWGGGEIPASDYHFHNGYLAESMAEAVFANGEWTQGVDPWNYGGIPYSGTAYVIVKLPQGVTTDDDLSDLKFIAQCLRVPDFDASGNQIDANGAVVATINQPLVESAFTYSTNPARCLADLLLVRRGLSRRRINWPAWYHFKQVCDVDIDWEGGEQAGRPAYTNVSNVIVGIDGHVIKSYGLPNTWDGVVTTTSNIPAGQDGWFSADPAVGTFLMGLSPTTSGLAPANIPVFIRFQHDGTVFIQAGETILATMPASWSANDTFKISVEAGAYRLYKNDLPFRTDLTLPAVSGDQRGVLLFYTHDSEVLSTAFRPINSGRRTRKRFECGLAFPNQTDINAAMEAILLISCSDVQDADGELIFVPPSMASAPRQSTFDFDMSNILEETFKTYRLSRDARPTKVGGKFRNIDVLTLREDPAEATRDELVDIIGHEQPLPEIYLGTMTKGQAECVLNYRIRIQSDLDLYCAFEADATSWQVIPGDVVTVSHDVTGWLNELFLVIEATDTASIGGEADTRRFLLQKFNPATYSDTDQTPIQVNITPTIPSVLIGAPPVRNVQIFNEGDFNANRVWNNQIRGTITFGNSPHAQQAWVKYSLLSEGYSQEYIVNGSPFSPTAEGKSEFTFTPLKPDTYRFIVYTSNRFGVVDPSAPTYEEYVVVGAQPRSLNAPTNFNGQSSIDTIEYSIGVPIGGLSQGDKYEVWASTNVSNLVNRLIADAPEKFSEKYTSTTASPVFRWVRVVDSMGNASALVPVNGGLGIVINRLTAISNYNFAFDGDKLIHIFTPLPKEQGVREYQIATDAAFTNIVASGASQPITENPTGITRTVTRYIRAMDFAGNYSPVQAAVTKTFGAFTNPVVALVESYPSSAVYRVTPPSNLRLGSDVTMVVEMATDNTFATILESQTHPANSTAFTINGAASVRATVYVRVYFRDMFGSGSYGYPTPTSYTFTKFAASDLQDAIIGTAKFAAGIKPVVLVSGLPFLPSLTYPLDTIVSDSTQNGKLFRNVSNTWVSLSASAFADLSGTLSAGQVPAGLVTNIMLAANSVGQINLQNGIVNADKLSAGAVTPEKLLVELGGGNLVRNSSFEAPFSASDKWVSSFNSSLVTREALGSAYHGSYVARVTRNTSTNLSYLHTSGGVGDVPIIGGKFYTESAWVKPVGAVTGTWRADFNWFDATGAYISATVGVGVDVTANSNWVRVSTTAQAPANAVWANVSILGSSVTGDFYIDGVQFESGNVVTGYSPMSGEILAGQVSTIHLSNGIVDYSKFATGLRPIETVSVLPTLPNTNYPADAVVILSGKLYRNVANTWTASVPTTDLTGTITGAQLGASIIDYSKFASGLRPIETVSALPTLPNSTYPVNAVVMFDGKLYRNASGVWTSAVPTSDLTGTIGTTQIADNAITTPKITANAVTATQIAANTITAAQIAAGTITAAQIAASTITGTQIAASTISAKNLLIGSFENLFPDGGFEYHTTDNPTWYMPFDSGWSITANANARSGAKCGIKSGGAANAGFRTYPNIPVAVGEQYYAEAYVKGVSANGSVSLVYTLLNNAGGYLADVTVATTTVSNGTYQKVSGQFTISASYPTASKMAVGVVVLSNTTGAWYVDDFYARRIVDGNLIVDGTIHATKLVANSITANQIAANTITAAQIAADTITAAQIAAGAITANELAANSVTANAVSANAITANAIAVGAITAQHIAVGSFSDNILMNGSFESGGSLPDGWTGGGATRTAATDATHGGYVVTLAASTGNALVSKVFPVTEGETYLFRGKFRAVAAVTSLYFRASYTNTAGVDATGFPSSQLSHTNFVGGSSIPTTWTQYSGVWTVPVGAKFAYVEVLNYVNGGNAIQIDEVEVYRQIIGVQIKDNTITAGNIVVGTLTGDRIAARTIAANNIIASSLTATEIASRTITADRIVLNAITANEIANGAIGDSQVSSTAGFVRNAMQKVQSPMSGGGQITFSSSAVLSWSQRFIVMPTALSGGGYFDFPPVAGGVSIPAWSALYFRTAIGGAYNVVGTPPTLLNHNSIGSGYFIAPYTSMANYMPPTGYTDWLIGVRNGDTDVFYLFDGRELKLGQTIASAEFIPNGSIIANFMAANSITANAIAAGVIVANHIATGTITGDRIAGNTITAANIAADTITAGQIAAGAITVNELAVGAVTADKIAANSITALQLAAGAVTAAAIAAGAVTADKISAAVGKLGIVLANQLISNDFSSHEPATAHAEMPLWMNKVLAIKTSDGVITTSAAKTTYAWDSGMLSTRAIYRGNGYIEWIASETDKDRMVGLCFAPTSPAYTQLNAAWFMASGSLQIYENGAYVGSYGSYVPNVTILRIAIEGNNFVYYKDGTAVYTRVGMNTNGLPFGRNFQYPMRVGVSLGSPGATVNPITMFGILTSASRSAKLVDWDTLPVGFTRRSDGNFAFPGAATSVSASSVDRLNSADGYIEFQVPSAPASQHGWNVGLAPVSGDFIGAVHHSFNGLMYVYTPSTAYVNTSYSYSTTGTDVYRVGIENGVCVFRHQGQAPAFYSASTAVTYPIVAISQSQNAATAIIPGNLHIGAFGTEGQGWKLGSAQGLAGVGVGEFNEGLVIRNVPLTEAVGRAVASLGNDFRYRGNDRAVVPTTQISSISIAKYKRFHNDPDVYVQLVLNINNYEDVTGVAHSDSIDHVLVRVYNKFGEQIDMAYHPFSRRGGVAYSNFHARDYADPAQEAVYGFEIHNVHGYSKRVYHSTANWTTPVGFVNNSTVAPIWLQRANCPTNVTVTPISDTIIRLSWTPPTNASGQTTYYRIFGHTNWIVLVAGLSNTANVVTASNLSSNTKYEFIVEGSSSNSWSNTVGTSTYSPPLVAPVTVAPSGLTATAISQSQINLAWTNGGVYSTEIYRNGVLLTTLGAGVTGHSDTGLAANTRYTYKVRHNNGGTLSAFSNEAADSTQAPPPAATAPYGAKAESTGLRSISVSFVNPGASATVQWGTDGITFGSASAAGVTSPYAISNLADGTTYYVRVVNSTGTSNVASATTDPYIPPDTGCVVYGTPINTMLNGEWVKMAAREILAGAQVKSVDTLTGNVVTGTVKAVYEANTSRMYTIVTESGDMLQCSPSHPIITGIGDTLGKPAYKYRAGDSILVYNEYTDSVVESTVASIEYIEIDVPVLIFEMENSEHTFVSSGVVSHNIGRKEQIV